MAAELAVALAPGRSHLQNLNLDGYYDNCDLSDGGGCASSLSLFLALLPLLLDALTRLPPRRRGTTLLAALGANEHLTGLWISNAQLGGLEAAAALAASLRSNGTLCTLSILGAGNLEPGMHLIFEALCGSAERPSRCSVTTLTFDYVALDLPACEALAESLSSGA